MTLEFYVFSLAATQTRANNDRRMIGRKEEEQITGAVPLLLIHFQPKKRHDYLRNPRGRPDRAQTQQPGIKRKK